MTIKTQKIGTRHFHPLRIYKKRGILELSDEQIAVLARSIVKRAEERILNEHTSDEIPQGSPSTAVLF